MSGKNLGTKFEAEIKQFLEQLEFNDVEGANNKFTINGVQVDVCGGWGNALLVIECKTKRQLGKKSLRASISEWRGKIPLLERGFDEHPKYKKYTFRKYIIITKNIDVRKADYEYAKEKPSIYIGDDNFLKHYRDLYSFIKPYAKYDLLGELRIKPIESHPITTPAFRTQMAGVNVYNFVMNPSDLLEISFVARREVGRERYYQRIIDKKRLSNIASYVQNEGGILPNNIIIAFDKEAKLKFHREKGPAYSNTSWPYYKIEYGILEFPRSYRTCWIIDGQHRLYSFVNMSESEFYFNMPIIAFENLDVQEQCRLFLDINKNQKPVDSDLLWDLNGDMIPGKPDGIISKTVKALANDHKNALYHLIYYPSLGIGKKREMLTISGVCVPIKKRKLTSQFLVGHIKNPLHDEDPEKCVIKVKNALEVYLDCLKKIFKNNYSLMNKGYVFTNSGISVMLGLYEKILTRIMQKYGRKPNYSDCEFYIKPLKDYFESADLTSLQKIRKTNTSEGARGEFLNELIAKIKAATGDNLFGGEARQSQIAKEFVELEKRLKDLIKEKLCNASQKNWFKEITDPSMYGKALKVMKKHGQQDESKAYLYIGLGECCELLRKHYSVFSPIFIGENKFPNKTMLEGALSTFTTLRGKLDAHYTGTKATIEQKAMLKINLQLVNKCLDQEGL